MPEPFKNLFNKKLICAMAKQLQQHSAEFDDNAFIKKACKKLDDLELKQRSDQITQALISCLPSDFNKAGKIMLASLGEPLQDDPSAVETNANGIVGWAVMPLAHYVALQGHDHFDLSMTLLKEMTRRFSSEFAIRFFLQQSPKKTLAVLKKWAKHKDQHVRRLVSEGARPRLPWAMQLPEFIADPSPVIHLLEMLKDDESEYVRRSVANNLNDIAKDHSGLVSDLALRWLKDASLERQKLIRHACRTLIKQGHKKTLKVLGYKAAKITNVKLELLTPKLKLGDGLMFALSLQSASQQSQNLMIDYIIHHQKANGSTTPKVFKWRSVVLAAKNELSLSKQHVIRKITTRVYYPGLHALEIIINGDSVGVVDFQLKL